MAFSSSYFSALSSALPRARASVIARRFRVAPFGINRFGNSSCTTSGEKNASSASGPTPLESCVTYFLAMSRLLSDTVPPDPIPSVGRAVRSVRLQPDLFRAPQLYAVAGRGCEDLVDDVAGIACGRRFKGSEPLLLRPPRSGARRHVGR